MGASSGGGEGRCGERSRGGEGEGAGGRQRQQQEGALGGSQVMAGFHLQLFDHPHGKPGFSLLCKKQKIQHSHQRTPTILVLLLVLA